MTTETITIASLSARVNTLTGEVRDWVTEHICPITEDNVERVAEILTEITDESIIEYDVLIPTPDEWHADDGNAEVVEEHESGEEAAQSYVDGGDWGEQTETGWITVRVWRAGIDADGDLCRVDENTHKITLEPDEPECLDGEEHDWQSPYSIVGGIKENPGVWGHGGGVTIQEVCMRCGCGKLTDTWSQDPSDGEQGLTSVSYEPGKYQSEASDATRKRVEFSVEHITRAMTVDEALQRINSHSASIGRQRLIYESASREAFAALKAAGVRLGWQYRGEGTPTRWQEWYAC